MLPELQQLTKLNLSENQIKVIKDKYLKNSPTIEHWLKTICHNIALADILHSRKINEEDIFFNINYKKVNYLSKGKPAPMYLLHHDLKDQNRPDRRARTIHPRRAENQN